MSANESRRPEPEADPAALMTQYEVWFIRDRDGVSARFPDFSWILTGGADMAEAEANAAEAFSLALDTLREEGLPLPEP